MASKTDNTKQTIYSIVGARVEKIDGDGELFLVNEDVIPEPINIMNMFKQYEGQVIDIKLGGTTPVSGSMFEKDRE